MVGAFTPDAVLLSPVARDGGEMFFLRCGSDCWALLFTSRESARAYRAAAGIGDRCNMIVCRCRGVAAKLGDYFNRPGNHVVGALLDPSSPSPLSGVPVSVQELLDWAGS